MSLYEAMGDGRRGTYKKRSRRSRDLLTILSVSVPSMWKKGLTEVLALEQRRQERFKDARLSKHALSDRIDRLHQFVRVRRRLRNVSSLECWNFGREVTEEEDVLLGHFLSDFDVGSVLRAELLLTGQSSSTILESRRTRRPPLRQNSVGPSVRTQR
jgi:hypothetical protein